MGLKTAIAAVVLNQRVVAIALRYTALCREEKLLPNVKVQFTVIRQSE